MRSKTNPENMKQIFTTLFSLLAFTLSSYAQWELKTNLPAVYINTQYNQSITSKTDYIYCTLRYTDEQGVTTTYDSVQIRGRGNSTWNMPKKPYRIKFKSKEKFLGKGYAKAKKWTLLANAADKSLMRNAVTFALGEFTSLKFNPAYKFVDLILNGTYLGTYQISDQIDVRPHRVDIVEQDYPVTDASNITGGYLMEVDGFRDGNCFTTSFYSAPVRIHYPDEEEISTSQNEYIRRFMYQFEQVLHSNNFANQTGGYRSLVDTMSLADWYICTEVSANIDGFYSTYFYKEQDNDRLFWGPLWDYDIAYNNDYRIRNEQYLSSSVNSLMSDIAYSGSKNWVNRMWEDPWFQKFIYKRYTELLDLGLVEHMHATIDSLQVLLQQSQELNYQTWGIDRRVYHEMVLYSSYDQYVSDLKDFITQHCAYLKEAFANKKPIEPTPPFAPKAYFYHIINKGSGKAIDVQGTDVVQYDNLRERESEDWFIQAVNGSYQLINRSNNQALNDPTMGEVGPSTNVGTRLNTVTPDVNDARQLWNLVPQGTDGYYNLENVYSSHIANLEGGRTTNNTAILSYTSDNRNGQSNNRLWYIAATNVLPDDFTAIENPEPQDYALAYNPVTQVLHFASNTPERLTFTANVFSVNGMRIGTFRADNEFTMYDKPAGIYVVTWNVGGMTRSVKFKK